MGKATLFEYNRSSKPSTDKSESRQRLFKINLELWFNQCLFYFFSPILLFESRLCSLRFPPDFLTNTSMQWMKLSVVSDSEITAQRWRKVWQQLTGRKQTCNMQSGYTQQNTVQVKDSIINKIRVGGRLGSTGRLQIKKKNTRQVTSDKWQIWFC